jgi:hypothetical protein
MLMAALEVDASGDGDVPGVVLELLGEPFRFAYAGTLTWTVSGDPVPADEVAGIADQAVGAFLAAYQEHLQDVVAAINALFTDLVREARELSPGFDAHRFLQRHALAEASGDECPAAAAHQP